MRFFIAALLCFLSIGAFAQSEQDQALACRMKGEIFQSAASSRDRGMPPETAYGITAGYLKSGLLDINKQFLKTAINLVYFDPDYANAGGGRLKAQMTDLCLTGGKPRFQPLK